MGVEGKNLGALIDVEVLHKLCETDPCPSCTVEDGPDKGDRTQNTPFCDECGGCGAVTKPRYYPNTDYACDACRERAALKCLADGTNHTMPLRGLVSLAGYVSSIPDEPNSDEVSIRRRLI